MPRFRRARTASTLIFASLLPALTPPASAQAPASGGGVGTAGAAPGSGAPNANAPTPGVSSGVPAVVPGRPLTLADVVAISLGGNSGLVLARQRLQKAQELISQVNAQARPQFRADAADTYTSYNAFAPVLPNPAILSPTLPGGGQIPVVVDQGPGFSTAFIGGGGGGNAPGSGAFPSTSLSATPSAGDASTPGIGTAGTPGVGTAPGNGAGVNGPAAPGSSGTGGAAPINPTTGSGTTAPTTSTPGGNSGAIPAPGAAPTAPATPAPPTAPGGAPAPTPNAPGGTAPAPGTGASLPPIVAGYVAELEPTPAAPAPEAAPPPSRGQERPAARPADTTGGGGSTTTTGPVSGGGGSPTVGKRDNYAGRVSLSQYLDLFGLVPAARDAQKDVRDFYALDIERLQNETALAAKNLFFNLLLTEDQVGTQAEQVRYAQEDVRITESRLRQGIVSRFDVLTAQAALSTAQQQLISSQDGRDLAQADLAYLLGSDPDTPLVLQPPPLPPLTQAVDLKQSTSAAIARRPEVGQAGSNLREAHRLVKLAGSPLLPTLGLVASGVESSIASVTSPRSYASLSAQLAVPLDDGGETRSRVRSALVDVQTQALTLEQIKLSVSLEVRQAALNVRNAQAQVGAAQAGAAQSQEAVRLAYLRYQGGLGTFLDVLNALAQLARARTNLSNANFFYQTSLAQLVRAMGGR